MLRSPSQWIDSSTRHTVGSDATPPNRSGCWRSTAMSARQSPPSASITANCVNTTPGSCAERRRRVCAIAADNPFVSPTRSANSASSNDPACDATPLPSPVTFTRCAARVPFTFEVPSRSVRLILRQDQFHLAGGPLRGPAPSHGGRYRRVERWRGGSWSAGWFPPRPSWWHWGPPAREPQCPAGLLRFQRPPVEPCVRFSRTRLTDVVHRRHSVFPARAGWAWERQRFRQG